MIDKKLLKVVDQIWGFDGKDNEGREFSAFASDLESIKPHRNICPACYGTYSRKDLKKVIPLNDSDEFEIGGWLFKCPECRTNLTVFND